MNYPENKEKWERGDIVIHDADAKEHKMLMRVVAFNSRNGRYITRYVYPGWIEGKSSGLSDSYQNDIKSLHNPRRFGLIVPNEDELPFIVKILDSNLKVETTKYGNIGEVTSTLLLSDGGLRTLRGWGDLISKFYDEQGFQFMPDPEDFS